MDWNDFGEQQSSVLQGRDENLFEVELRNDLMDSPPAVGWESDLTVRVLMVVVAVRLIKAMTMVVIDRYQC
ncbi:hypothetical protein PPACK8108_LOCUS26068 [Phakopsora pachyrhizi]|uniref:Uncharacterized protein n=1 Tax=Phakopsora pachyrhizi TaxID=170000 RepID=A0AAV0BVZ5_PHAPC|nr:hypothetical protein PPACK8108_LOCUS26068 [Phakopsora pachyrhizi]